MSTQGHPSDRTVPGWRTRITGRWAISWQAYGVGVALNVPLLVLTGGSIGTQSIGVAELPLLLAVGAGAALVVAIWLSVAERTWMRQRPVSLSRYAVFHLGSGMIFGAAVVVGDRLRDAPESMPAWARIVITMGIGLWFGITMSLLLEARDRYARDRHGLLEQAVAAEAAALRESEAAVRMRAVIDEQVDAHLSGAREHVTEMVDHLRHSIGAAEPSPRWLEVSESIRETASGTVRGLSRVLWESAERQNPAPRADSVISEFLRWPRFLVGPSMAIIVVGYLSTSVLSFGWALGPLVVIGLAVAVGGLMAAANAVARRHASVRRWAYLGVLVFAQLGAASLSILPVAAGGSIRVITVASSVLGMGVSIIIPSVVASINALRERSLADLQGELVRSQVAEQAWMKELSLITREVATHLHGKVQTRLIACSGAIDRAVASGDAALLDEALSESLEILRGIDRHPVREDDLATGLARLIALWEPFCRIRLDVDPALASRSDCESVLRIAEEAMANAYRHGGASHIDVEIQCVETGDRPLVGIRVSDDGAGLTSSSPGLGTTLFDRLCEGEFSLVSGDAGGAVLTAHVRLTRDQDSIGDAGPAGTTMSISS